MSKVKTTVKRTMQRMMQRVLVLLLLCSALLFVAGCGGGASEDAGSSGDAPAAEPTRRGLATMPAARFAAPTSMITPEGSEAEVEATATLTATEEMTETEEITETEEVTSTEEVTE